MFQKILIANRGEIALRILRACRQLGVRAVVAYSEADADSLPVRLADEAICIGPAAASRSYLHLPSVVTAALVTGCEAIHPGYGFLAENPYLADICERYGLAFVGPPPRVLEEMADKTVARRLAQQGGLAVLPGSDRALRGPEEARRMAEELGYPVVLKAAFGGGGRGMRVVASADELLTAYPLLQAESQAAFGQPDLYLEKFITSAHHIEVQVLADRFGRVVPFAERDCSLQRRSQKIIEESPAPGMDEPSRQRLGQVVAKAVASWGYVNAGTVEFLADAAGHFYFIEMNTRIQVEHPVTEMVSGVDLVQWQLRLAAGEPLTLGDVELRGHAIEARLAAEDPLKDLRPEVGTVRYYLPPGGPGIRVDSHLYSGYEVPPFYDSLLGKVVAWGSSRDEALTRLKLALAEFQIQGIKTNLPLLRCLVAHPVFERAEHSTDFVESCFEELKEQIHHNEREAAGLIEAVTP